jgi:sec-independent protein translocase protein TatA
MSGGEIFVIVIFILVFFGAESIPKISRQLGKVMYQVKNATDDIKRDIRDSANNIKKDIASQTDINNPLKEIKKEIDDSVGGDLNV